MANADRPYLEGAPPPHTQDWDTREWWEYVKRHELVVQRCSDCGAFRHTPVPVCWKCRSFTYGWMPVSGRGVVYSWTIARHPAHPSVKDKVPYNIAIVELPDADHIRMVGNLVDVPEDEIEIGMPVEVTFEDISDGVTLPQWRRVS